MLLKTYAAVSYWPTRNLAPSTMAGYLSDYKNHVLPRWGDVELADIRAADIEAWIAPMKRGVAVNALGCLRRILRKAERDDLIELDPTRKAIELPKRRVPYQPKVLSLQDARAVLRGFYGHPLEAWVLMSICTGTRRCESLALTRRDFNSREGMVSINKGLQTVRGEMVEWFTKTPHSVRTVYLPRFATARLREIWKSGPICQEDRQRMSPDKVARLYRTHCQKNSLPFVPPTNLRHSYVGLALASGAPMWWVQSQLGHAGGSSTLEAHYLWTDKTLGKRYARLLDDLLPE